MRPAVTACSGIMNILSPREKAPVSVFMIALIYIIFPEKILKFVRFPYRIHFQKGGTNAEKN